MGGVHLDGMLDDAGAIARCPLILPGSGACWHRLRPLIIIQSKDPCPRPTPGLPRSGRTAAPGRLCQPYKPPAEAPAALNLEPGWTRRWSTTWSVGGAELEAPVSAPVQRAAPGALARLHRQETPRRSLRRPATGHRPAAAPVRYSPRPSTRPTGLTAHTPNYFRLHGGRKQTNGRNAAPRSTCAPRPRYGWHRSSTGPM
jgi:hypothetical protein